MKVWITKYALTQGVIEAEANVHGKNIAITKQPIGELRETVFKDEEWRETKESAISKAEEMRQKKISSLRKQIEGLEKMRFE